MTDLQQWAARNAGETLLPTGKLRRNLNPILEASAGERTLTEGWWGYLVNGEPARFASINTRSERLAQRTGGGPSRALVPATSWYELQKPHRQWQRFAASALHGSATAPRDAPEASPELFMMAAVTQPGRTADGASFTCYSILMRPAPEALEAIHDRVPVLIPAEFAGAWLTSTEPARDVTAAALAASDHALARIGGTAIDARP